MTTLIRKLFWFSLFMVFTLGFVTFFDHGFVTGKQFSTDAKGEVHDLMAIVHPVQRPPDKSDQLPQ